MLRDYQTAVIESALQALTTHGSAVLQMPTGSGKTKTATEIAAAEPGGVWFICHRREIIRQASAAFAAAGIEFGTVAPGFPATDHAVQIASIQTLRGRIDGMPEPRLVIWDECHHVAAGTWSKVRNALPNSLHLGLSATPERLDGKGLSQWFAELVRGPSIKSLVSDGWLVPMRYLAPSVPDLKAARIQAGDYQKKDLATIMSSSVLIGDAVAEYQEHTPNKRAIAFCATIEASEALVARFLAAGVPAAHVDGATPPKERDAAVEALRTGAIKVLSNVEVFTEGFDLPDIDAAILLRPTKSLALFLQMVGRVLRPAEGKDRAVIFDHSGLWADHGLPDQEWEWSLEGEAHAAMVRHAQETGQRLRRCPECREVRDELVEICGCGFVFPTGRAIGEFDGVLSEIANGVPEGCVTLSAFSKILGIGQTTAYRWSKRGMPLTDTGLVHTETGIQWVKENTNPSEYPPTDVDDPENYLCQSAFCKHLGLSPPVAKRLVSRGIPTASNGWIHKDRGAEWFLANYNSSNVAPFGTSAGEFESAKAFGKRIGVSGNTVRSMCRKGMPKESNGWVNTQRAMQWLRENWTSSSTPPFDVDDRAQYVSVWSFAKAAGTSDHMVNKWKQVGLPHAKNGWIHLDDGLAWLQSQPKADPSSISRVEFAASVGLLSSLVGKLIKRGLPADADHNIVISDGIEWLKKYNSPYLPPFNVDDKQSYEPAKHFGLRVGLGAKFGVVYDWRERDLPSASNGWVHIQRGLEWVRDNTDIEIPPEAWSKK